MLKKKQSRNLTFEDDDVIVMDKKTKRRLERQRMREEERRQAEAKAEAEQAAELAAQQTATEEAEEADDAMSQIARLGQANNWREAVLVCRRTIRECQEDGRDEMVLPLTFALAKLEMSLRRQMASAFMVSARKMLKKEYLLDVGEE